MRPSRRILVPVLLLLALASTGCAGKSVALGSSPGVSYDRTQGRTVSGSASGFQLLLLIPININDRHERAYESLLAAAAGDVVTDVRVQESWTYALIGTVYKVQMDAMVYPRN